MKKDEMQELRILSKVHIGVMGYEIDRIIEPLKRIGVSRFYLLIDENENEMGKKFIKKLKERIVGKNNETGLLSPEEFKEIKIKIWDYRIIMGTFCKIINDEIKRGSSVYVNISSGSKLAAVAGTFASLMYGAKPYYVRAKKYNYITYLEDSNKDVVDGLTSGVEEIIDIPEYTIEKPDKDLITALSLIGCNTEGIIQKDLVEKLKKEGLLDANSSSSSNEYITFRRKYLHPLLSKGWVTLNKEGKTSVMKLTPRGINTLKTFYEIVKS